MECERFEEPLDLAPSADSDDQYFTEALLHAESCPACRQKLERRLQSERSIRAVMENMAPVPDSLHDAIMNYNRRPKRPRRLLRVLSAAAASILLIVGISVPVWNHWKSYQQTAAVERLCLLSIRNHEVTSSPEYVADNRREVSEWLSNRLGRLVKFPDAISLEHTTLSARRVVLGEHTAAAVEFVIDGKRSTIFSFYPRLYNVVGVLETPRIEMGYTVAFWSENGLGFSLVSEASPEQVEAVFTKHLKL